MFSRVSVTAMLTAVVVAFPLSGCVTPEELAIAQERRQAEKQTGSNIARRDHGNTRTTGVSDREAQDQLMKDAIKLPDSRTMNRGGGG